MAIITLPNGTQITATEEMITRLVRGVQDGVHYNSSAHGRVRIEDMATPHLRNAICKIVREEASALSGKSSTDLYHYLTSGLGHDNLTLIAMVKELGNRYD